MNRNKIIMYLLLVVALLITVFPLAGCTGSGKVSGTSSSETQATAAPAAETTATVTTAAKNAIAIQGNAFNPENLSIKVGDTVTWINNDSYAHTVTALKGEFESGNIAGGGKFSFTFSKEGTYEYKCSIHTFMKGTVTVTK